MRLVPLLRTALCWAGLLAGGCVSQPEGVAAGLTPPDAHVGVPLCFSPRVVGDKRPDFFTLKSMLDAPQFHGQTGAAWTRASDQYFSSAKDGSPWFGQSLAVERRPLRREALIDPLQMIDAYGWVPPDTTPALRACGESHAHTMDFVLRPGETLIRSQRHEGRAPRLAIATNAPPPLPLHAWGNGRWIYEPKLTAGYLDFAAGVRERSGLTQTADGLCGAGQCVIPFVTPYPFVARPTEGGGPGRAGAWITLLAAGDVTIEINDALGQWTSVPVVAGGTVEKIDISPLLESRYAFNLRLTLGASGRLSQFRLEGVLLTAPMTLPRLEAGVNLMTLYGKDKYGLKTVPYEILPDFRAQAMPLDQQVLIHNGEVRAQEGWQNLAPKRDGPVQATFTLEAPAGEKFAWFYALVSVADAQQTTPAPQVQLEWRCGHGDFLPLGASVIEPTPLHVAHNQDGEQLLAKPVRSIELRVTSDTPIQGVQFVGHLALGAALAIHPRITHRWLEDGAEHQFVAPPAAEQYFFRCGANPTGHVIEMSLPSYQDLPPAIFASP